MAGFLHFKSLRSLILCGLSVIVLGVWSVVKAIIEMFTEFKNGLGLEADTEMERVFGIILISISFIASSLLSFIT